MLRGGGILSCFFLKNRVQSHFSLRGLNVVNTELQCKGFTQVGKNSSLSKISKCILSINSKS